MRSSLAVRSLVFSAALVLLGSGAFAQQPPNTTKPYEPQVGQPGKDVVWVPTPQELVDKMLDMAKTTAQDYVIDLGSGDGRTVITAAKRGARATGIEYEPEMVELAKRNAAAAGVGDKATFLKADLFESDFSKATVITMFLLPSINLQLRPKILDLKPGTRIVSNSFDMQDWEADEKFAVTEGCTNWCTALLWIVPRKVGGAWQTPQGTLTLVQQFQMISGTLGSTPISEGRVRGDEVTFRAGAERYTGQVDGNVMKGTAASAWQATRP